jgi:hypothetical protein
VSAEIIDHYNGWSTAKLQRHMQVIHDLLQNRGAIKPRTPAEPVRQIERKEAPEHLALEPIANEPVTGVLLDHRF